ncbi:MAG: c-type cytochrome [Bryobacterales bacterium]|nr:c-type cytochrome [Bryobacterales bacterium]MDE0621523.1 c-type cytochrome [Bryobacterales bacterium]
MSPQRSRKRARLRARARIAALASLAIPLALAPTAAQRSAQAQSELRNPLGRDAAAVEAGNALFHERCAVCHGQQAEGAMASNLVVARSVSRGSEAGLFKLIRAGIPGTEMPPQPDLPEERLWQLVSYLRSLAHPAEQPPVQGDVAAGQAIFQRVGCAGCHIVNGAGGFLGPPLDSIGVRHNSDKIREDLLDPSAELAEGFGTVVIETAGGETLEGVLKNEDSFTLLVLTADGDVKTFQRKQLRSVHTPQRSKMPADYGQRLRPEEVQDLLAFLDRQRDPFVPVRRGFGNY